MELSPKEVRELVLADHAALRVRLDLVKRAVTGAQEDGDPRQLRELLPSLLDHLSAHLDLEDQILAPTLKTIDAWGPERAERLDGEHRDQRAWIAGCRGELVKNEGDVSKLLDQAAEMIDRIEDDMDQEEKSVLDPRLLTDEIIQIDFGG